MALSEALYFALPFRQRSWTPEVFNGVGIRTSIFWARRVDLNCDFRTTWRTIKKCVTLLSHDRTDPRISMDYGHGTNGREQHEVPENNEAADSWSRGIRGRTAVMVNYKRCLVAVVPWPWMRWDILTSQNFVCDSTILNHCLNTVFLNAFPGFRVYSSLVSVWYQLRAFVHRRHGCQIESFSIRYDFRFKRCRNLSIRFWFDIDSIQFTIRLDRKPSQQSWKKKFSREIGQSLRGDPPQCQKQLANSFVITFCELSTFDCHGFWFLVFESCSKSNRIKSYRKKYSIRSAFDSITKYDSIWIRFDSPDRRWFGE